MPPSSSASPGNTTDEYSLQELGNMLFDVQTRLASTEENMMTIRFDQEAFARQQTKINQHMDDTMNKLLHAVDQLTRKSTDQTQTPLTTQVWSIPASPVTRPASSDFELWPKLKLDPPHFDGANVTSWIERIQTFYNHSYMPLADRLYLTPFLLGDAAAEWHTYWEANNNNEKSWDDFLVDIKLRFDSDSYEDRVGQLAALRQTGTLTRRPASLRDARALSTRHPP